VSAGTDEVGEVVHGVAVAAVVGDVDEHVDAGDGVEGVPWYRVVGIRDAGPVDLDAREAGAQAFHGRLGEVTARDRADTQLQPTADGETGPRPDVEHAGRVRVEAERGGLPQEDLAPDAVHPRVERQRPMAR
jgi:hypothetical protein